MKRKVFAGSAVAAALLFQLTAVSFPAYAAEHRNQREQHAEQKGNRDPDQGERLLGQIAGVIDIAVLRLGDELVGKLGE